MFFVDATMIRKVDQNGIISTLLGANDLTAVRPLSCDASMDVSQVRQEVYNPCMLRGSHKSSLFFLPMLLCIELAPGSQAVGA